MRLISAIHRWASGFVSLLLAVLGLTGAILIWEGEWVTLSGPDDEVAEDVIRVTDNSRFYAGRARTFTLSWRNAF